MKYPRIIDENGVTIQEGQTYIKRYNWPGKYKVISQDGKLMLKGLISIKRNEYLIANFDRNQLNPDKMIGYIADDSL